MAGLLCGSSSNSHSVLSVFSFAVKCQDWTDEEGWMWGAGAKIISVGFCEKIGMEANGDASDRTDVPYLP